MGVLSIDLRDLTTDAKLRLLEEIWDDLSRSAENLPISEEVKTELDRRKAAAELIPESLVPWEVVRERLRNG